MNQTQTLYEHAKQIIPGGTQLLSKRPEQFAPDQWPAYFTRAIGCEVWDLDNTHYYDMTTNGIGACLLGYADPDVTQAVTARIQNGCMSTLNPPEEVALADRLLAIHPWADQARFARTGGEAVAVAVRIARATTDRQIVAICGYSGWHDWYLAANLGENDALRGHLLPGLDPSGVPGNLRETTLAFSYNNKAEFDALLKACGDRLAAVVMEPCRYNDPEGDFLNYVKDGAHRVGALLIFDEITIGWRLTFGGAHLRFGVAPDIAVFAKALGNGHPIAAVIGTEAAMDGAESSFISSTYWTESVGPVAALATLDKMENTRVWAHAAQVGQAVTADWDELGKKHALPMRVGDGYPCLAHFAFTQQALALKTLYTVRMLKRGFLGNTAVYPTLAHTPAILAQYRLAIDEVFGEIARAIRDNAVEERIGGPVCQSGFKRLIG